MVITTIIIRFLVVLISLFAMQASAYDVSKTDSRVKTLIYDENDIYKVVMYKDFQTIIELGNGEEIETISLGNPYAWSVTPLGRRIFIKPQQEMVHTNLTVISSKRSYNFEILSKMPENKVDEDLAYVVRFYYPDEKPSKVN